MWKLSSQRGNDLFKVFCNNKVPSQESNQASWCFMQFLLFLHLRFPRADTNKTSVWEVSGDLGETYPQVHGHWGAISPQVYRWAVQGFSRKTCQAQTHLLQGNQRSGSPFLIGQHTQMEIRKLNWMNVVLETFFSVRWNSNIGLANPKP